MSKGNVPTQVHNKKSGNSSHQQTRTKTPLRWTGILFAFAANVLLVTLADMAARRFGLDARLMATILAPVVAGMATALYTRERGGMHALVGAVFSMPLLVLFVFASDWPLSIFAAAFCTMGAAFTELALRRQAMR